MNVKVVPKFFFANLKKKIVFVKMDFLKNKNLFNVKNAQKIAKIAQILKIA